MTTFSTRQNLTISINEQLTDPITCIHCVSQSSPLFPILFIFFVNDIPQPTRAQVNLSKFILQFGHRLPRIRSMSLRLQQYLNQVLTWCDRWRIKLNPGKTRLLNFPQRKVISDIWITMYGQPLKIIQSKFLWSY